MSAADSRERLKLVVSSREVIADGVVEVVLRATDGAVLPEWTAGAHIGLHLTEGLVRQYSLCGAFEERDAYTIAVLREINGKGGSAYVHDELALGDTLVVDAPRNNFELAETSGHLLIAGGIGITPLRAMAAELTKRGTPWRLVYGARTKAGMAYADDLGQRYGEHVSLHPQETMGLLPVADLLASCDPLWAVQCCGPEPLLNAVEQGCRDQGRPAPVIERFVASTETRADNTAFELVLERSGLTLQVGPDQSILDAIEGAGVIIDSSCRDGTCGTCETGVLAGRPDHRDVMLSEEERAANDTMMVCVSRSCGGCLVLDL